MQTAPNSYLCMLTKITPYWKKLATAPNSYLSALTKITPYWKKLATAPNSYLSVLTKEESHIIFIIHLGDHRNNLRSTVA